MHLKNFQDDADILPTMPDEKWKLDSAGGIPFDILIL